MPIGVGETVGDYAIEEHIGHGTEGDVFLARDVLLGRRVALKTLRSTSADATHCVEEARLMAGLEHPNIVRVYHAQRQESTWLVIFEHVAGGSLHAHIERAGPLPPARAVELIAQAACGLGHAHELGILHRDVKPQNLLLSHRGELKLADFGLALDVRGAPRASRGAAVGTPAFLAPELWGVGTPTRASDIYSLGGCLYFMLTGRVPFPFASLEQLERAHRELRPELSPEVPSGVRRAVLAMMAKDPALRPPSASQLARELSALGSDPNRQIRAPGMSSHRPPESPIVPGGAELGLATALIQGPDRIYLERLLELLHGVRALELSATPLTEAKCLLRVALERCAPERRVSLRLPLPTAAAPLGELLRQKANVPAGSGFERVCQELAAQRAGVNTPCVVEVHAAASLSAPQAAEFAEFARAAAAHDISAVLLTPVAPEDGGSAAPAALPGFERLRLPGAGLGAREFLERVRLWIAGATGGRGEISADAVRLLHHYCREHGHFWPQLTQDSLLISAAARLPVVTTWAVQTAQARTLPLHALSDVPVEWRAPPRRWPSASIAALLSALRQSEQPDVASGDG